MPGTSNKPLHVDAVQGESFWIRSDIRNDANEYATQSSFEEITYKVWDTTVKPPVATVDDGVLGITDVIFNTPQTDGWTGGGEGYNFKWQVSGSLIPHGKRKYRIEVRFEDTSAEHFYLLINVRTSDTLTDADEEE